MHLNTCHQLSAFFLHGLLISRTNGIQLFQIIFCFMLYLSVHWVRCARNRLFVFSPFGVDVVADGDCRFEVVVNWTGIVSDP
jgi:hypothetical protein